MALEAEIPPWRDFGKGFEGYIYITRWFDFWKRVKISNAEGSRGWLPWGPAE